MLYPNFQDRYVATLTGDDGREWESFRLTSPTRAVRNALRKQRKQERHESKHHTAVKT